MLNTARALPHHGVEEIVGIVRVDIFKPEILTRVTERVHRCVTLDIDIEHRRESLMAVVVEQPFIGGNERAQHIATAIGLPQRIAHEPVHQSVTTGILDSGRPAHVTYRNSYAMKVHGVTL